MAGKNIVLCSDGTGNAGGKGRGTNVWQLFLAVDQHAHEAGSNGHEHSKRKHQLAFYDDGVGTSSFKPKELVGLALGYGLGGNIRDLYIDLARNYRPDDSIFLFGFSRGAFTVRSLAGMIAAVGVIDGHGRSKAWLKREVKAAYKAYRAKSGSPLEDLAKDLQKRGIEVHDASIHFLGVWDTVSAVGVPFDELRHVLQALALMRRPHDADLNPKIEYAYQALAIDEARKSFELLMFNEGQAGLEGRIKEVEQVWFPGVHSNVGGGYPKKGMERVSLHWMMTRAEQRGLHFVDGALESSRAKANVHSKLYDSRAGLATYYRYKPRNVTECCAKVGLSTPKVHLSALRRISRATMDYGPVNLPPDFDVVGTWTNFENGDWGPREGLAASEAPRQEHEEKEIRRFSGLLSDSRHQREQQVSPARRYTWQRSMLYYLFLAVSLFVVSVLGTHELASKMEPSNGDRLVHQHPWAVETMDSFVRLSDSFNPWFSWASPALGWLPEGFRSGLGATTKSLVNLALPDLLAGPVLGLAEVPALIGIILLVGLALFLARGWLIGKMSTVSAESWKGLRPLRTDGGSEKREGGDSIQQHSEDLHDDGGPGDEAEPQLEGQAFE